MFGHGPSVEAHNAAKRKVYCESTVNFYKCDANGPGEPSVVPLHSLPEIWQSMKCGNRNPNPRSVWDFVNAGSEKNTDKEDSLQGVDLSE